MFPLLSKVAQLLWVSAAAAVTGSAAIVAPGAKMNARIASFFIVPPVVCRVFPV
jgi:hypothetical protein